MTIIIKAPGIKEAVVKEVRSFMADTGMSKNQFGIMIKNDHKFVDRLFDDDVDIMASNLDRCCRAIINYRMMLKIEKDQEREDRRLDKLEKLERRRVKK